MPEAQIDADYLCLLRKGYVRRDAARQRHDAWREEMRRRCRDDRLRVRTGSGQRPPHVWATLLDWEPTPAESGGSKLGSVVPRTG